MGTWEWGPNMKTFVAHFNLHQQASVVREALKKQVDRMTQPDNLSQPLPSGVPKAACYSKAASLVTFWGIVNAISQVSRFINILKLYSGYVI